MIDGKRILGLIPARGGSKGLPRKNILPLGGAPLITWTIRQSLACPLIDRTVVSTDSPEIAAISREAGADVPFLRPAELAVDSSPTIDTIFHALDEYHSRGEDFDLLALLEPTSPLRRPDDLARGLTDLARRTAEADSVISLGEVHLENPFVQKLVVDGRLKSLMDSGKQIHQRQQYPQVYFPYGVLYASTVEALRRTRTFYGERAIPLFIERWQNYEIDDHWDFLCIEAIFREKSAEMFPETRRV